MTGWRKQTRLAVVLSAISMLAACQTTTQISATEAEAAAEAEATPAVCRAWLAIRYSRHDTPETQRQVIASNAARRAYGCPE